MVKEYRLGLDIGSTTAKTALLDGSGALLFSRYGRHGARADELLCRYLEEILSKFGDISVRVCVTGSVGMASAERLRTEFVQEVIAAAAFARRRHPEAKALVDIGGEDAKVVFFDGVRTELRMNGNCAGGTGAFIDQMASLLGTDAAGLGELALGAANVYPMAARCGVFAKTDVQNLMSRNLPKEDIAASIFHSVAVQTVVTLSRGLSFKPPILLCGGPLTFLPALRKAFRGYLNLPESAFIVSGGSCLVPAEGCALKASGGAVSVSELIRRLKAPRKKESAAHALPRLFSDDAEYAAWLEEKKRFETPVLPMNPGRETAVIGIDSGSTTTKLIAVRVSDGAVIFSDYSPNLGNPVGAVLSAFGRMKERADSSGTELVITGSCATGYGEELIRTAFGLDSGIIETMAHYRAASKLLPGVTFILDIGGQDMKAIFTDRGAVVRMELNEACSSGCGTFIETFASGLGCSPGAFAKRACRAGAPCDLGTRCTVFMNSKVKQVLREGAGVDDIAAGIAYSVVRNCLYKVLKLTGRDSLGDCVVLQGGTMKNDAVVRAFELLAGVKAARSSMPEMMGAYGCALHALGRQTGVRPAEDFLRAGRYETKILTCGGCENRCLITRYRFGDGKRFYSGNKCEKKFTNRGVSGRTGENAYEYKCELLFGRESRPDGPVIGIPRSLGMYEEYPFWHALLKEAGFRTVLSAESTFANYEKHLSGVMSDAICFPAKLTHAHVGELNENPEVEKILMPYTVFERNDDPERTVNSYNCPIVSGYSDVIRSAVKLEKPLLSPVINFSDEKLLKREIVAFLAELGVGRLAAGRAFRAALSAEADFRRRIREKNRGILERAKKEGRLVLLIAGRPYHADPLIQHKISEAAASLGADVITDDIVRDSPEAPSGDTYLVKQWAYMNRIVRAAAWTAEQGARVHFVQLTSFGCGPDAFIQDEIRDILKRSGKPYTLLKLDDVSNVGSLRLRLRSLIESLSESRSGEAPEREPLPPVRVFTEEDSGRTILAPFMTEYANPILRAVVGLMGFRLEILPMSDRESAELGLQNANNEVCYPATLVVGDVLKALKSGRYDLKKTAVAMSQTGGQCRATNYAGLIRRAMANNGFGDVPLVTVGVTSAGIANEQRGFSPDWKRLLPVIVTGLFYGDALSAMHQACLARERRPGAASEIKSRYLALAEDAIRRRDSEVLISYLRRAAGEFDRASCDADPPKAGIVGEIFLKFNAFAHQHVGEELSKRGIEVLPPLLAPFFLQEFVNVEVQKKLGLGRVKTPAFLLRLGYRFLAGRRLEAVNEACGGFRYFRPFANIYDDAETVTGIVSLAEQAGEGWLLPAEVARFAREGADGVISLQPFGCIANHVVSKGIEKALCARFPNLSLLSLDFDSGVSEVNVTNRLMLFADSLKEGRARASSAPRVIPIHPVF